MRCLRVAFALGRLFALVSATPASVSSAKDKSWKPLVNSEDLQDAIEEDALLGHAKALQRIAYATPGRNRLAGTQGHIDTVKYIYRKLTHSDLDDYYNVTLQQFPVVIQLDGSANLTTTAAGQPTTWKPTAGEFSPNGTISAPVVLVNGLGCNTTDYPSTTPGSIALIVRGNCTFAQKSAFAGKAGALAAIVYNNVPGNFTVSLGSALIPEGPKIPTVGLIQANGTKLANLLKTGTAVNGVVDVRTHIVNTTTQNLLVQTTDGDEENVLALGAHTDSVKAGPGINDDGSGTAALLEVALQLTKFRVRNAVRFGFWSGEEEGLVGSKFYVNSLSNASIAQIKAYLNFDMIASPNGRYATFDGAGRYFNKTGIPAGSAVIDKLFREYFRDEGLNITAAEFTGRSDYASFFDKGIPTGGLAAGSDGIKNVTEQAMFGGTTGKVYDENYHGVGDNVTNLNVEAFVTNTKAIAHAVATFGRSFDLLRLDRARAEEAKRKQAYAERKWKRDRAYNAVRALV